MQKTIDLIYICYWAHLFANRITKSSTVANDANTNAHFNLSSYSFNGQKKINEENYFYNYYLYAYMTV